MSEPLKVPISYEVDELRTRVRALELEVAGLGIAMHEKKFPSRLELAESNLEQCRELNGNQKKEIDRLRTELDVLRLENSELRQSNQRQDKALCDMLTYKRVVTYDLNLSSPESLLKYVRELEDQVMQQKEDIDSLEESLSRPRWVTGDA